MRFLRVSLAAKATWHSAHARGLSPPFAPSACTWPAPLLSHPIRPFEWENAPPPSPGRREGGALAHFRVLRGKGAEPRSSKASLSENHRDAGGKSGAAWLCSRSASLTGPGRLVTASARGQMLPRWSPAAVEMKLGTCREGNEAGGGGKGSSRPRGSRRPSSAGGCRRHG